MPATEPADSQFEKDEQSVTEEDTARLQLCHIATFFDLCVCTVRIMPNATSLQLKFYCAVDEQRKVGAFRTAVMALTVGFKEANRRMNEFYTEKRILCCSSCGFEVTYDIFMSNTHIVYIKLHNQEFYEV